MNSTIKCCYQCSKREVGCHAWCEDYLKERAEWNAMKEETHRKKKADIEANLVKSEGIRRMVKEKNKRISER